MRAGVADHTEMERPGCRQPRDGVGVGNRLLVGDELLSDVGGVGLGGDAVAQVGERASLLGERFLSGDMESAAGQRAHHPDGIAIGLDRSDDLEARSLATRAEPASLDRAGHPDAQPVDLARFGWNRGGDGPVSARAATGAGYEREHCQQQPEPSHDEPLNPNGGEAVMAPTCTYPWKPTSSGSAENRAPG